MKRWFYRVVAIAVFAVLAAGATSARGDGVLFWMVTPDAMVTHPVSGTEKSLREYFADIGETPADSYYAARVRVTGGNITTEEDVFLDIYYEIEDEVTGTKTFKRFSGEWGVDFSDQAEYWSPGYPDGKQSPIENYSADSPEYSFIIELGNVVWEDDDNGTWTTVATSAAAKYSSLGTYIHEIGSYVPVHEIWAPTTFTVPEPSGGLLTLFGVALLALRRRRES